MKCKTCEGNGSYEYVSDTRGDINGPFEGITACEDCDGSGEWHPVCDESGGCDEPAVYELINDGKPCEEFYCRGCTEQYTHDNDATYEDFKEIE